MGARETEQTESQKDEHREEEKKEIEEMETRLGSPSISKPSSVSKAMYNKWLVMEEKRMQGELGRVELDAIMDRSRTSTTSFLDSWHDNVAAAKAQREAAAERVRKHREAQAQRGAHVRDQVEEQRQQLKVVKSSWVVDGAAIHKEHKERLEVSRNEKYSKARASARALKQRELDRAAASVAECERQLEEKRQRVARIRDETKPEVVKSSKEMFYSQRLDVANGVRENVSNWRSETEQHAAEAYARAQANRAAAYGSRSNAADGKAALVESNKQTASAMRTSLESINARKSYLKLTTAAAKRNNHDEAYEAKFVGTAEATAIVSSPVDKLANAHRADGLPSKRGSIIGKPNWRLPFGGSGWFSFRMTPSGM